MLKLENSHQRQDSGFLSHLVIVLALVFQPLVFAVHCEAPFTPDDAPNPPAPGPLDHPSTDYLVVKMGAEGACLLDGSLTPEQFKAKVRQLLPTARRVSLATYNKTIVEFSAKQPVDPPIDEYGNPLPPPMKLPDAPGGVPNEWVPIPGSPDRAIKWKPRFPIPSDEGGQPNSSWDPDNGGHWDKNNGLRVRIRQLPDGTPVDHFGNPLCPVPAVPNPFTDYNFAPVLIGIGIIALVAIVVFVAPYLAPVVIVVAVAELG